MVITSTTRSMFPILPPNPRAGLQSCLVTAAGVLILSTGFGWQVRADAPLEYNRDIRPILADNCFACHGPDSAARKADLRLDRREAAVERGAITAGIPGESELIARIFSDDPEVMMPPPETEKSLTDREKGKLKQWISAGARYQRHWSLIAPQKSRLPAVQDQAWVKNAIDHFVLARLEANGLSPAPQADANTLFRRLYLDITGLPPSPEDVAAFVSSFRVGDDHAVSVWIDRLISSSGWGEHRARYWLDAARYGDTHGMHFDNYREIWIYRDWVVRALNANQAFDQFTVEQLAGDLLPDPTEDQLIATGFQRCNMTTNEGGTILEENLAIYAADRVQTLGWVYLGLTTNCCQCHDHKFDPLTMTDYYSLAAYFRNTTQKATDGNTKDGQGPSLVVPYRADAARWKNLSGEMSTAMGKRDTYQEARREGFDSWLESVMPDSVEEGVTVDGLVVHLPLNEGSGTEVQNRGTGPKSFTSEGQVKWIQDGKIGPAPVIDKGVVFDLGQLGDFEKDQPFSFGAWIKAERKGVVASILGKIDLDNRARGWDIMQNKDALNIHMIHSYPENYIKVSTRAGVVQFGRWQHVFVTYDGTFKSSGFKVYIDGIEEPLKVGEQIEGMKEGGSLTMDASIRTETPLLVGRRTFGKVFKDGAIQDVRLYSRTLDAAEVQNIAYLVPLASVLAMKPDDRTGQQQATLFDHSLLAWDSEYFSLAKTAQQLEAEYHVIKERSPVTHIQQERSDSPAMAHILMRGQYDKPGKQVQAAPPAALHPLPDGVPRNRLGLARWLVDPANPLTARVTVNRFWQEIFGRGIVTTPEDFGVMGAAPSHPELLDWLAVEFRQGDWDVKKLFKTMLMSATYRQAAVTNPEKLEKDRDNALLSRGPRFRMDAEMVRDYALSVSGLLVLRMYGPGTKPRQPVDIWEIVGLPSSDTRTYMQDTGENLHRRTVYHFWKRMAPPPNLDAFNAPSREVCTVRRERTNTPLQALVTLNDPQFIEAASHLARRAIFHHGDGASGIIKYITRRVLCRPITSMEERIIMNTRDELLAYYRANPEDAKALVGGGDSPADDMLNVTELAVWTMVCNQVMNLDEVLNK